MATSSRSLAPTDNPARDCGSLRMPPEGGWLTVRRAKDKELTMAGKTLIAVLERKPKGAADRLRRARKSAP